MEITHNISASYDDLKITISPSSFDDLESENTVEVDDSIVCIGSHDDVDISINSGGRVNVIVTREDVASLLKGELIVGDHHGIEVVIDIAGESPLEYLERTWNEPRYGETPLQHFNRIHGVSE